MCTEHKVSQSIYLPDSHMVAATCYVVEICNVFACSLRDICACFTLLNIMHCTMLDLGLPCFGHLARSPFLDNILVLEKLHFLDDLDFFGDLFNFFIIQTFSSYSGCSCTTLKI